MARHIIEETDKYIVYHHNGISKFQGCQCFRDCSCNEEYKPYEYNYYTVFKKVNKPKTTHHNTLDEVKERVNFINTIQNTNNPKWINLKT